jgi:hypothetical protein
MSTTASNITAASFTSTGALTVGGGTAVTKILKGVIAVTVAAGAAAAEEDISVTITGLGVTDVIILTPLNAAMETGVGILAAWCSVAGTMKIRVTNASGTTLTGSTSNWNYALLQS